MIRTTLCAIIIYSFVSIFSAVYADKIFTGADLKINGRPATLEAAPAQSGSTNIKTLHPYSADLTGLKNELTIYRLVYFTVMTAVVGCLIWGVNSKH